MIIYDCFIYGLISDMKYSQYEGEVAGLSEEHHNRVGSVTPFWLYYSKYYSDTLKSQYKKQDFVFPSPANFKVTNSIFAQLLELCNITIDV